MTTDAQFGGETTMIEALTIQSLLSNTKLPEESKFNSDQNMNSEFVPNFVKDSSDAISNSKSNYKILFKYQLGQHGSTIWVK